MTKYLDPTNDSLFKKIFSDAESAKEFINSILDLPPTHRIKEIEYLPVDQLPNIHKGKKSSFDLKVKDESGNWYIIEMQKKNESDYLKRVQYYSAHSYTNQLKAGITHIDLLPIVVISLIKTTMFDSDIPYISFHKTIETTTNKQYLYDLSYVFIELGKFNKNKLEGVADEWLHMFKCASKEEQPPSDIKSPKVLDAYHAIEMHGLTEAEYDLYIRTKLYEDAEEIALVENFTKGIEQGKAEGKAEERIELAKKMLARGKSTDEIIDFTELSIEEITKLKG